jgi:hypothetical protein
MEMSCQIHASADLLTGKEPQNIKQKLGLGRFVSHNFSISYSLNVMTLFLDIINHITYTDVSEPTVSDIGRAPTLVDTNIRASFCWRT